MKKEFILARHKCQAMSELCVETLWYGGQTDAIARQLNLCYIFILKKSSKLYIHYQIALNTPLQGKEFFLFPCLKILLGYSNRWTLYNPHQLSCSVRSS